MPKLTVKDRSSSAVAFLKNAFISKRTPVRLEVPVLTTLDATLGTSYHQTYSGETDVFTGVVELDDKNSLLMIHGSKNQEYGSFEVPFQRLYAHMKMIVYKIDEFPQEEVAEIPPIDSVKDLLSSASLLVNTPPTE